MNNLFPISYSTLSAFALAAFIQEKYGFPSVRCKMILRGVGDSYLITAAPGAGQDVEGSDSRFILRVYRPDQRSLSQIMAEIDLLLALKLRGVPVSWPIADRSGAVIQAVEAGEGMKHMVLFSYAPGRSVLKLNEKQLYNLGYQMARFHEASRTIELQDKRWTFDLETTLFKPLERLRSFYADDSERYAWLQRAASSAKEKLEQLNAATLPAGFCHFDFLPKNFHFDGDAITFFDFDFFGYGLLANDIMVFWQHLCLDMHFGRMTQDEGKQAYHLFLKGYQDVRPVSRRELAAVPYLSLGWWLFYADFHTTHDQFYPLVQPAQLELRNDLIRKLMEKHWEKAFLPE
jgi:Ser/Thr protein kinase RdoA (MazF antagonist)